MLNTTRVGLKMDEAESQGCVLDSRFRRNDPHEGRAERLRPSAFLPYPPRMGARGSKKSV